MIASLQHFRHYLLNVPVILRTNHHSLKWLQTFKRPEGIPARWVESWDAISNRAPTRDRETALQCRRRLSAVCKQYWGEGGLIPKIPWADELQRADECTEPLTFHALQILPELSEETVRVWVLHDQLIYLWVRPKTNCYEWRNSKELITCAYCYL